MADAVIEGRQGEQQEPAPAPQTEAPQQEEIAEAQ
jgi:hypothetical protein